MKDNFKLKIIKYSLLIAVVSNWIYDFCVIHNFKDFGGYSAYSASIMWFHERNIHEFTGGLMIDTILLVRYLTLHKLSYFMTNIVVCLSLFGICISGIVIQNYYFWATIDSSSITLFNKILVVILLIIYVFVAKKNTPSVKND